MKMNNPLSSSSSTPANPPSVTGQSINRGEEKNQTVGGGGDSSSGGGVNSSVPVRRGSTESKVNRETKNDVESEGEEGKGGEGSSGSKNKGNAFFKTPAA